MNLCRPDHRASCAACCGLYNVPNATRLHLREKLRTRTSLFADVPRTADALVEFKARVLCMEGEEPLDPAIHVCEFAGFVDDSERIVGCLLHPSGAGNQGVDLRGLCHYGSMACKAFFCPSWEEVPPRYIEIASAVVDDWHLHGLVITDAVFLRAVFGLLERTLGRAVDASDFRREAAARMLGEILGWKDAWPLRDGSLTRRSRYYLTVRGSNGWDPTLSEAEQVVDALDFTFGVQSNREVALDMIVRHIEALAQVVANP